MYNSSFFDICRGAGIFFIFFLWFPFWRAVSLVFKVLVANLSLHFRLWQHVTRAINNKDQTEATQEKFVLEEAQRKAAKERKTKGEEWTCNLFELDPISSEWQYKFAE